MCAACTVCLLAACAGKTATQHNLASPAAPSRRDQGRQLPEREGRWLIWGSVTGSPTATAAAPAELHAAFVVHGRITHSTPIPGSAQVQWAPVGNWLSICGRNDSVAATNTLSLLRFSNGGPSLTRTIAEPCGSLFWSQQGSLVTIPSSATPWSLAETDAAESVPLPAGLSPPLVFSADGKYLIASSGRELWRVVSLAKTASAVESWELSASSCDWAPDAPELLCRRASSQSGAPIRLVRIRPGTPSLEEQLDMGTSGLLWTRWVGRRGLLARQAAEKGVLWRSADQGPSILVTTLPGDPYVDVVLSPTGRRLAIATETGLEVWDTTSRPVRIIAARLPVSYASLTWSANGRYLAARGRHPQYGPLMTSGAWIVDTEERKSPLCLAEFDPARFTSVSFSPGSAWVIVGQSSASPLPTSAKNTGQPVTTTPSNESAYHLLTGNRFAMPVVSSGWWAPDDSALVSLSEDRARLRLQSTEHGVFGVTATLGPVSKDSKIVQWAP